MLLKPAAVNQIHVFFVVLTIPVVGKCVKVPDMNAVLHLLVNGQGFGTSIRAPRPPRKMARNDANAAHLNRMVCSSVSNMRRDLLVNLSRLMTWELPSGRETVHVD